MKVCLVGPDSVHIRRFYGNMKTRDIEFLMLAEEEISWFDGKQFTVSFRTNNGLQLLKNYKAARAFFRKVKPDVVHIHQINRLAVVIGKAAKKEGLKIIETAWGSDVLLVPKRNKFYAALTRSALQKADRSLNFLKNSGWPTNTVSTSYPSLSRLDLSSSVGTILLKSFNAKRL